MVKSIRFFALAAASALAMFSCQRVEVEEQTPKGVEYVFALGNADDTKATIAESVVWDSGDRLGTFTPNSQNSYSNITAATADTPASFSIYSQGGLAVNDMIYCYYPYSASAGNDKTTVKMSIPTTQNEKDAMPMASIPYKVTEASANNQTSYAGKIQFVNLGAVVELNIYSTSYADETVTSVEFQADQAIAGDFDFDLTGVDYSDKSTLAVTGYSEKTVTYTPAAPLAVGSSKADATIVNLVVAPGSYTGKIVVYTDKAVYTYPITTAKQFDRSVAKPLGVNLREDVRSIVNTVVFDFTSAEELEALRITLPADNSGSDVSEVSKEDVTLMATGGSINTRIWNSGDQSYELRIYKGAQISLSVPHGYIIESVMIEGTSINKINYPLFPSNPAVFSIDSDADAQKVKTINVVYREGVIEAQPLTMSEVSCETATSSSLIFAWPAVIGAIGYKVSLDGGNTYGELITATSYTWSGLDVEEEYTIYVKAIADGINALDSNPVTASGTTLSGVVYPVTDVLNKELTGNPSSYTTWSGKTSNSPAVYAGNSSGDYSSIQLRKDNNSGIVTTVSGGYATSIKVTWNASTASERSLNIYGKSTPYTSTENLFKANDSGVLIGTIKYGESTELSLGGFYEYIGVQAVGGAVYLTDISITWDDTKSPVVLESLIIESPQTVYNVGDDFVQPIVKARYSNAETKIITATFTGNDLTSAGEKVVTVSYTENEKTITATYIINVIVPQSGAEAILSFADKSNRTSYSSAQQVWVQNGITFTNNKASSTTSVGDYANPVRVYKGSEVIVEKEGMIKIVFHCSNTSYANALYTSITVAGVNVSQLNKDVTIVFPDPVDSFTIASISALTRFDSLTVTYI